MIYYIMGVSGCGKSTLGKNLATHLSIPFYDGDDFHPEENVAKMAANVPLTDEDRVEWLNSIHAFVSKNAEKESLVFACSALKKAYREVLAKDIPVTWVYLEGSFEVIQSRIMARQNHYMPPSLLKSQFDTLEEPDDAIWIAVSLTPEQQLDALIKKMNL